MWATEWKFEDALKIRAEEAWEDGKVEGKVETAAKMKAKGIDIATIVEVTELPINVILDL